VLFFKVFSQGMPLSLPLFWPATSDRPTSRTCNWIILWAHRRWTSSVTSMVSRCENKDANTSGHFFVQDGAQANVPATNTHLLCLIWHCATAAAQQAGTGSANMGDTPGHHSTTLLPLLFFLGRANTTFVACSFSQHLRMWHLLAGEGARSAGCRHSFASRESAARLVRIRHLL